MFGVLTEGNRLYVISRASDEQERKRREICHSCGYGYTVEGNLYYIYPDDENDVMLSKSTLPSFTSYYFRSIHFYEENPPNMVDVDGQIYLKGMSLVEGMKYLTITDTDIKEVTLPSTITEFSCDFDCEITNLDKMLKFDGISIDVTPF